MTRADQILGAGEHWRVENADTLALLPRLPDCSVDAVVTDPPYGIDFQHADWDGKNIRTAAQDHSLTDGQAFQRWATMWATECLRVLKPGGHLVAFSASRTGHRLACGLEDAGFELRDTLMWMYGSGMPKSRKLPDGQGTALKPAYEPAYLARKPLSEPTVLQNVDRWGTGALNTRACQILEPSDRPAACQGRGRWPANVLLDHGPACTTRACSPGCPVKTLEGQAEGTSRFFYHAKANRPERDAGCDQLPAQTIDLFPTSRRGAAPPPTVRNPHPTVKPLAVMRWLVRLSAPAGGLVLDPFCGSGSTGCAARLEGRPFLGIELDPAHAQVARARIAHWDAPCPGQGRRHVRPPRAGRPRRPA